MTTARTDGPAPDRHAATPRPRKSFTSDPDADMTANGAGSCSPATMAAGSHATPPVKPARRTAARAPFAAASASDTCCGNTLRAWAVDCRVIGTHTTGASSAAGPNRYGRPSTHATTPPSTARSEEHTSALQSRGHLVCRLLLEKKKQ